MKSLEHEIADIIASVESVAVQETVDKLAVFVRDRGNKVLDAAVDAVEGHPTLNDFCKGKAIKAIQRLKEGK